METSINIQNYKRVASLLPDHLVDWKSEEVYEREPPPTSSFSQRDDSPLKQIETDMIPIMVLKIALKLAKSLRKNMPWRSLVAIPLFLFTINFIDTQNEARRIKEALLKRLQFSDQVLIDHGINKSATDQDLPISFEERIAKFSLVKDEKTLEILSAKVEEISSLKIEDSVKLLIVSTWKTGSDFFGDLLSEHPATYYSYEPLAWFGINRFIEDSDLQLASDQIRALFRCSYQSHFENHRSEFINNPEMMIHNRHLWPVCRKYGWRAWCLREEFLDNFCSIFPIHVVKTARIGINVITNLLQDTRLTDLQVLLIVRDPRAIMFARKTMSWCQEHNDCKNPQVLCKGMEEDFSEFQTLIADHPTKLKVVRYEDFAADTITMTRDALNFIGLTMSAGMDKFLKKRVDANAGKGKALSTSLDKSVNAWQSQMSYDNIDKIQKTCQSAMEYWGYKPLTYEDLHPNRALLPLDFKSKSQNLDKIK